MNDAFLTDDMIYEIVLHVIESFFNALEDYTSDVKEDLWKSHTTCQSLIKGANKNFRDYLTNKTREQKLIRGVISARMRHVVFIARISRTMLVYMENTLTIRKPETVWDWDIARQFAQPSRYAALEGRLLAMDNTELFKFLDWTHWVQQLLPPLAKSCGRTGHIKWIVANARITFFEQTNEMANELLIERFSHKLNTPLRMCPMPAHSERIHILDTTLDAAKCPWLTDISPKNEDEMTFESDVALLEKFPDCLVMGLISWT
jgi:hypothetical protein